LSEKKLEQNTTI